MRPTKVVDSSNPYFYQFTCTGKYLKSAELKFYRITHTGQ
ncbi:type VI secretion system tube protein Hcp [Tatumella ptyseos]